MPTTDLELRSAEADCWADGRADRSIPRMRPGAVTLIVTAAIAGLTALTAIGYHSSDGWSSPTLMIIDLVAAVLCCAAVPLLFVRAVPTALALTVLALISPLAVPAATVSTLLVARFRPWRTAVIVAALGVVAHGARGWWRSEPDIGFGWWMLLVVAGQAALAGWGAWNRTQDQLIMSLRGRAMRAEAEQQRMITEAKLAERHRIARELHDVMAHRLSLLATYAGALEFRADVTGEQRLQAAKIIRDNAHRALDELREVIWLLRDRFDDPDDDLVSRRRPGPGIDTVRQLLAESEAAGLQIDYRADLPEELDPALGRTIYRVLQEGLTNVRKHAPGQQVHIVLDQHLDGLSIELSNEVRDHSPGETPPDRSGAGAGLIGLTERVELAGGTLATGRHEHRFVLKAWLPWHDERSRACADR